MRIAQTTPSCVTDLWSLVEPDVRQAARLTQAAQALCGGLRHTFHDTMVLARLFLTVPFDTLPPGDRRFVETRAAQAGVSEDLGSATPILSLIGTAGIAPEWNDRSNSVNHLGIPLIPSFVDSIPMISRLLKELGIPLSWVDRKDAPGIAKTIGRTAGLFLIDNATEAVDKQGRLIISDQPFTEAYCVQSVIGVGSAYVSGQVAVLVVFCREQVPRSAAEQLMALTGLFAQKTGPLVGLGRVFDA